MRSARRSYRNVATWVPVAKLIVIACTAAPSAAIVTSDGSGTHIATPSTFPLGIDHIGVGRMFIMDGSPTPGICTCTLLAEGGGRFALTAAHCLSDGTTVIPVSVTVAWTTASGTITATAVTSAGQIHVHPMYDGDVFHGHDIAVLEFDAPIDPAITRYELSDSSVTAVLGLPGYKVGYGTTGSGATGDTGAFGTKRVGLNKWQSGGLGSLGVTTATAFANNDQQLTFDFDRPDGMRDGFGFFFPALADPGYGGDEVMVAVGDSGGPTFVDTPMGLRLAGVASYRTRVTPTPGGPTAGPSGVPFPGSPDVDAVTNSSWGEFGVDAHVAHAALTEFIRTVVLPCLPDFNGSGAISVQDIFDFLAAYFGGDPDADFNESGSISVQDIFDYLAAYFAGCP